MSSQTNQSILLVLRKYEPTFVEQSDKQALHELEHALKTYVKGADYF